MTKEDRDALRKVAPAISRMLDELIEKSPSLELKKVLDGVHTDTMVANHACVNLGYMELVQNIHSFLRISGKAPRPGTRKLATRLDDIPKDFKTK